MKTNFHTQLTAVVAEASNFIREAVKKKKKIVLVDEEKIEVNGEESEDFLEAPTFSAVDKHFYYEQYAVMSIEKGEDDVLFNCIERGENRNSKQFKLSELSSDDISTVCYLADLIAKQI